MVQVLVHVHVLYMYMYNMCMYMYMYMLCMYMYMYMCAIFPALIVCVLLAHVCVTSEKSGTRLSRPALRSPPRPCGAAPVGGLWVRCSRGYVACTREGMWQDLTRAVVVWSLHYRRYRGRPGQRCG